jgi:hypothetical protein
MKRIAAFLSKESVILCAYLLACLALGLPHYLRAPRGVNNFIIFKQSLPHLLAGKNLYLMYPAEYADQFLYHPTFCILFAPFSLLPLLPSLLLWLAFCTGVFFLSIKFLPIPHSQKVFLWWFVLLQILNSINSQQTNPLLIACGLFTFIFLEKSNMKWAALFPVLGLCVKGYGIIFAALFIFYPKKKQFLSYSVLWLSVFTLLPLMLIDTRQLVQVYSDWANCLNEDHRVNFGFSIMGLAKLFWPSLSLKGIINFQLVGIFLFGLTLLKNYRLSSLSIERKLLIVSYISLWVIMFNHAAESQTFIVAVVGAGLFYLTTKGSNPRLAVFLTVPVFLFSMLFPMDIFPQSLRQYQNFLSDNLLEVVPCLAVWIACQFQLLKPEPEADHGYIAEPALYQRAEIGN